MLSSDRPLTTSPGWRQGSGLSEDSFRIEAAWGRQFCTDKVANKEYTELIATTRCE